METQLPPPMTLSSQNYCRAYTQCGPLSSNDQTPSPRNPRSDDENEKEKMCLEGCIDAVVTPGYTENTHAKQCIDFGTQMYDAEVTLTVSKTDDFLRSSNDENDGVLNDMLQKKDLKDNLANIYSTLERLAEALTRVEETQNVILKRINRKRRYTQFLID